MITSLPRPIDSRQVAQRKGSSLVLRIPLSGCDEDDADEAAIFLRVAADTVLKTAEDELQIRWN